MSVASYKMTEMITSISASCAPSSQTKKTNKNITKKSVALHNHSFLITMCECFFLKWISRTRIWFTYCYPSLPSGQIAHQGKAYAWSLYYHNNLITIQKQKRFKTMFNTSKCTQFNIIASLKPAIMLNWMHLDVLGIVLNLFFFWILIRIVVIIH